MNYYQPSQRQSDGLWVFTVTNDDKTYLAPCCEDCPGHTTEQGARDHQKQYLIDNADLTRRSTSAHPCRICRTLAQTFARTPNGNAYPLCADHLNAEGLAQLVSGADSASSW